MTSPPYHRAFTYDPPRTNFSVHGPNNIFTDDDILILNKPAGLLTVPGKSDAMADCVQSRVREHFNYARIVHRLDMSTSGILIMARHYEAQKNLSLQFEKRLTRKTYIANISGHPENDDGEINAPMRCDWPNRPLQMIDPEQGKTAMTKWDIIERYENYSRVRLYPITGRSHQLRLHMLHIGHPILGDRLYAPDDVFKSRPRLHLHAETLTITHPSTGEELTFTAPCPF